jgi:hypothetical protein
MYDNAPARKLRWLLQLTAALKLFPIPHILRTFRILWLIPVSETENLASW